MALSRHRVEVGATAFYIARFDAFRGLEVAGDLQKRFAGPIFGAALSRQDIAGADVLKLVVEGLREVSAGMGGKELVALARQLLDPDCISVEIGAVDREPGVPVPPARKLDASAMGEAGMGPEDIVELCVEVVRHNFAPFIARFAGRIGEVQRRLNDSPPAP